MSLPLLTRVADDDVAFALTRRSGKRAAAASSARTVDVSRIPDRQPAEGEQYRFHFDMAKCIGCKCCVVACNEQNGNPAAINWRRVGEIEGGCYPHAQRALPLDGLQPLRGADLPERLPGRRLHEGSRRPASCCHSADTCIGCQYCTWNCSYGVPQYNPERGVVGKCDMCHSRLARGRRRPASAPAPKARSRSRSSTSPSGARDHASRRRTRRAVGRRQHLHHAHHAAGRPAARRAAASTYAASSPSIRTGRWSS